ncbi:MAG: hypothetical protein U1E33_02860 [Rhodospirillales bacterium]
MLEGAPVLEIASAPLTGWSGLLKNIEDRAVALGAITLPSPLLLLYCHGDPPEQPRTHPLPAEALWSQQPGDRRLQVPLDVSQPAALRRVSGAGDQERPPRYHHRPHPAL